MKKPSKLPGGLQIGGKLDAVDVAAKVRRVPQIVVKVLTYADVISSAFTILRDAAERVEALFASELDDDEVGDA